MARAKLLVDSNIVIDYLHRREGFFESARRLMLCGRVGEFSLWLAASQLPGLVYVLSDGGKATLVPDVLEKLRTLRLFVSVLPVGQAAADAMLATHWDDPEDTLLQHVALQAQVDAIISRDEKFKALSKGRIPVYSCSDYFAWLEQEQGIVYADIPFSRQEPGESGHR